MNIKNPLYWKISVTLLALLVLLGVGYIFITSYTSQRYFQEVNQRLYSDLAEHLVEETLPIKNGEVDTAATHDIMHSMMVINPSVEVYLLDTDGYITDYVVPFSKVKRASVALQPVRDFLTSEREKYILGDDPKDEKKQKVFSAAPITENDQLVGYAYVILASEEQDRVSETLFGSYMLTLGTNFFFVTLVGALIIGLIALYFLTKNLSRIIETVKRFKEGDYEARIDSKGDFNVLSETFNAMADQIVTNIEKIKSVDQLRQELIANVSHDLRTPLSIMQGYIETLMIKKDQLKAADQDKYLNIVMSSSEKLAHLVSQLFEYSKLEANQIEPQKEPFHLTDLAQDIHAKYQILAAQKNIKLQLHTEKELPIVFADLALVERAIQNLIDNALKFTPENGRVDIYLDADNNGVEVKICDSGPGIPKEQQPLIFERYRKTEPSGNSKGAGLGLAIVKKILEIHNATIQVSSLPNQGATFWFRLPVYQMNT